MAQRLGERVRGPTEATGLYRAVLLRSGKWGQVYPAPRLRESARRAWREHCPQPLASRAPRSFFTGLLSYFPFLLSSVLSFFLITFFLLSLLSFLLSFLHSSFWGSTLIRYIALFLYMHLRCARTYAHSLIPDYKSPASFHLLASPLSRDSHKSGKEALVGVGERTWVRLVARGGV